MLKEFHDQLNANPSYSITKNKIDRHLRDINDTISEEDISNVSTDTIFKSPISVTNGIIEIEDKEESNASLANINNKFEKNSDNWNIVS